MSPILILVVVLTVIIIYACVWSLCRVAGDADERMGYK